MSQHIKTIFEQLRAAGASSITISFDGSGDSGSIESVDIYNADNQRMQIDLTVIYPEEKSSWVDDKWITETEEKEMPIADALEAYCYDELQKTEIDWYNNEGGFGQMTINLDDKVEIELEVNTRYTEYKTDSFDLTLEN
jgi:hypothetical protein